MKKLLVCTGAAFAVIALSGCGPEYRMHRVDEPETCFQVERSTDAGFHYHPAGLYCRVSVPK